MYRYLFGSEGAYGTPPATFSASFPGAYLSLFRPKLFFFLSPSHIAAPPAKGLTNHIANGVSFVAPAPVNFVRIQFTRAGISTVVNSQGLIEQVPADTPRFDHDPITLFGLLEEARTNLLTRSNAVVDASMWLRKGVVINTMISGFPIFSSGLNAYLMTGLGSNGGKFITRSFPVSTTERTLSVFMRKGTNDFAQILGGSDFNVFTNYDLALGSIGTSGPSVTTSTITPWKDGWYRCTLTTSSSVMAAFGICLIPSINALRAQSSTLNTFIYVAGPQMEEGAFATSYIPTDATAETREADDNFAESEVSYPAQLDLLGAAVTRSHIGLPIASGETAGMARLAADGGGLREWGGELLFVS